MAVSIIATLVGRVLSQSEKLHPVAIRLGRQTCQHQDTLHHLQTVIGTLFRIDIENFLLVIGQGCRVTQYLTARERCRNNCGEIEGLFALPIDTLKLPSVPIMVSSTFNTSGDFS